MRQESGKKREKRAWEVVRTTERPEIGDCGSSATREDPPPLSFHSSGNCKAFGNRRSGVTIPSGSGICQVHGALSLSRSAVLAMLPLAFRGQVKTEPRPKLGAPAEERRPKANLRVDLNLVLVPGDGLRSLQSPGHGSREGTLPRSRRSRGADHHAFLDGRRAGGGRPGLRHQRQYGPQAPEIAHGGRGVFQDRESRRRVLPGGVQRPAEDGGAVDARRARRSRTSSPGRNPKGAPRCSMRSFWR